MAAFTHGWHPVAMTFAELQKMGEDDPSTPKMRGSHSERWSRFWGSSMIIQQIAKKVVFADAASMKVALKSPALCSKRTKAVTGITTHDCRCIAYDDAAPIWSERR